MKKRLLLSLMAMCMGVSGFALSEGEYVYTPQGRFQITGANAASSNFADFTGWTLISESAASLEQLFNVNADGYASGMNSVQSINATAGEGMYFKFEPTSASESYVVSFKMKGAALDNVRVRIPGDGYKTESNLVKVAGNDANTYTHPSTEGEVIANTAEELTENWQTFNYAIVGDGTARTWFISFTAMATTIEIADLQIAPAVQVADLRQRDAMLEKLNVYKNCYAWDEDLLEGINETIGNLQKIGNDNLQSDLDELLNTAQEVIADFVNANMDEYLAGNSQNYLGFNDSGKKLKNEKTDTSYGDWTTTDRAAWANNSYPDIGHYAGNTTWAYGNTEKPLGVYMNKTLDPGSYVFGIEGLAAVREDATSSSWTNNDGLNPAYGVAYVVKVVDGAASDTIVSVVKDLKSAVYTPFLITAKIEEAGTYEIGFKAYCKDAYKSLKNGSVTYVKDASIWGKNGNKYNQKQLQYEADVREQITTGRNNLTTATERIASADYYWGKLELQACVDSVETKIAAYELLSQDDIIATYEEDYVKSTSAETGYMVYEVYQTAVKDIIAANKKFVAVNDTLNSLQVAIDDAKTTLAMRLYSAATGTADLQGAIEDAEGLYASKKKQDYSEENAFFITSMIEALSEAVEKFKASVPAEAITTIVDIDFEQDATLNETTQLYSIAGAAGAMEFTHFSTTNPEGEDAPFQQGHWDNGEQKWKGYLRVGNGTGVVNFDPTVEGDMGTNILKVACDFYIQGLNNRSIGFYLKDASDENVSGLYRNYYQPSSGYEPFGVDVSKIWAKSGGSYNDASPADADEPTATTIQKTHFEVILDYGRQSMYCTISSPNGSTASSEVAFAGVPVKFVLQCDYDNKFATRRCWFDNLKIERVAAGETTPFDGIQEINTNDAKVVAPSKVLKNGRIIINGKYGINGVLVK